MILRYRARLPTQAGVGCEIVDGSGPSFLKLQETERLSQLPQGATVTVLDRDEPSCRPSSMELHDLP